MTKNTDQLFQERIDELLLLEQRVDRRAEKFIALTQTYQEKSQSALQNLLGKVGGIDESLAKMNAASERVNAYVRLSATHATRTAKLFLGTVLASVCIIAGTLWWSHHVTNHVKKDRAAFERLFYKTLKHKPLIKIFKGKEYVRVVPNSEKSFTNTGSDVPVRYSKVWHVR